MSRRADKRRWLRPRTVRPPFAWLAALLPERLMGGVLWR